MVSGADDEEQVIGHGEPVEQPTERANTPHEGAAFSADGQVDYTNAGSFGATPSFAFYDPAHCAVQQVGQQFALEDYLATGKYRVW